MKHGSKVKICSKYGKLKKEGCALSVAKVKICIKEGCTNTVVEGVCRRNCAKVKLCSTEGCTSQAWNGGVCYRHGDKGITCRNDGCTNFPKEE